MESRLRELSQSADKGDADALTALFEEAERLLAGENFCGAASAFRDSAIAYRIAAFREGGHRESAQLEATRLAEWSANFRRWIEANPRGLRALPLAPGAVTPENVRRIFIAQLMGDEQFEPVLSQLYSTLEGLGMEFHSPGGSFQRRAINLVNQMLALSPLEDRKYLDDVAARICLDLIADEILRRAAGAGGQ